ncbi:MAG: hypothetical protein DDT30_01821 [Dehalococcoidia bacterium]|nr:hypothetical protein [Bacillota bacterium]
MAPRAIARSPVLIGLAPAIEAARIAVRATGGVMKERIDQYRSAKWTAIRGTPKGTNAGATNKAVNIYTAITGTPIPRIKQAPAAASISKGMFSPPIPVSILVKVPPTPVSIIAPTIIPSADIIGISSVSILPTVSINSPSFLKLGRVSL